MRVSEEGVGEGVRLHTGHKNSQDGARERERQLRRKVASKRPRPPSRSFVFFSLFFILIFLFPPERDVCRKLKRGEGAAGRVVLKRRDGNSVFRVS